MCSRHLKPDGFKWTQVWNTLKPESIPSVFGWTKEVTPRRQLFQHPLPEKRDKVGNIDIDNEDPLPETSVEDW